MDINELTKISYQLSKKIWTHSFKFANVVDPLIHPSSQNHTLISIDFRVQLIDIFAESIIFSQSTDMGALTSWCDQMATQLIEQDDRLDSAIQHIN
ncbi:hypothetical protein [Amphibacillus cookii]|uniref:hypothetical protein n=1 Tax=Amphibacillus cookii TaxID=767787 RepID=UPI00195DACB9|nr:hypothetical protein [Amphibacillus cookii]MBM7541029.1 hypothetical protein [Amphibacillus cookii]